MEIAAGVEDKAEEVTDGSGQAAHQSTSEGRSGQHGYLVEERAFWAEGGPDLRWAGLVVLRKCMDGVAPVRRAAVKDEAGLYWAWHVVLKV